ncbi:MAG: PQQ-binding-like beta-propeller repeat protein [Verrucomicrobiota bacterium]
MKAAFVSIRQNWMGGATLSLGAWLAGALSAGAADWPQYRGPNLDGTTSETLILKKWPASMKPVWKRTSPNGFSSITVSGGRAFMLETRNVQGAEQEIVVAVDANSGKEIWAYPLGVGAYNHNGGNAGVRGNDGGDGPRSTPSVDGNRVYVMSANLLLFCLDAASGKRIWYVDLIRQYQGKNITWKNAASPLVDGNMVFVAGGGPGQALLGIDKTSGKVLWAGQDDAMTHSTPVAATIHGTRQVIFFTQKGLVSVQPKDGKVLWRYGFPFKVSTAITPVVAGDIVYCSAGYGVGAGACKVTQSGNSWSATEVLRAEGDKPLANHWSTPVLKDGHLYGMFQFKEYGSGPIKCVELPSGRVKWEKPGFGPGNVILVDGHLVALSDDGQLVLIEATPAGYKEVARTKMLNGKCWTTPTISNGRIYARSTKEAVCIDVSGKLAAN